MEKLNMQTTDVVMETQLIPNTGGRNDVYSCDFRNSILKKVKNFWVYRVLKQPPSYLCSPMVINI